MSCKCTLMQICEYCQKKEAERNRDPWDNFCAAVVDTREIIQDKQKLIKKK